MIKPAKIVTVLELIAYLKYLESQCDDFTVLKLELELELFSDGSGHIVSDYPGVGISNFPSMEWDIALNTIAYPEVHPYA